ncbi:hypothetical protein SBDP1_230006 [Syntrophobacter sp. SbD1]|nr:hypothetical protein SBDP1_230006 [Syntrophobacter sp. SbD1]
MAQAKSALRKARIKAVEHQDPSAVRTGEAALSFRCMSVSSFSLILQKMSHCVGRGPNCRYSVFQLKLGAGELLTPIFDFVQFVRIDSVVSIGSSLYSGNGHWRLRFKWRHPLRV